MEKHHEDIERMGSGRHPAARDLLKWSREGQGIFGPVNIRDVGGKVAQCNSSEAEAQSFPFAVPLVDRISVQESSRCTFWALRTMDFLRKQRGEFVRSGNRVALKD
jgi:hypothetical protein